MKNIIITALLVSNIFTSVILYGFMQGRIESRESDFLTTSAAASQLQLAKNKE